MQPGTNVRNNRPDIALQQNELNQIAVSVFDRLASSFEDRLVLAYETRARQQSSNICACKSANESIPPIPSAQMNLLKTFLSFALVSGLGWLCDFGTFTLLVKVFDVPGFVANFISSYVGITFVWFTSLKTVFGLTGTARGRFLLIYWGFQFLSILAYSQLLYLVHALLGGISLPDALAANSAIAAKIIVTPFNLVTNFIFMKWLMRFMKQERSAHA